MAEPRSLKPHARSRREFGLAVARLCRYESPRKTVFRKRLPVSAAAGLRKLFHSENHWDGFDFGFNKALYTGPDAVVGPFTDLSPEERDICKFAPSDIPTSSSEIPSDNSTSVKLHPRPNGSTGAALVVKKREPLADTDKPPAYDNKGQLRNRNSSLTRTQIDEFFEVSQENVPFPAS